MGASKMERAGGGAPEAQDVHVASSSVQLIILQILQERNLQPQEKGALLEICELEIF
jgi:hypothetical protein